MIRFSLTKKLFSSSTYLFFLSLQWVETCVRPKEGLTKAMLEMYMQDGGTLGDVLHALLQLECLDILEATKPKVEKFLQERERYKDATSESRYNMILYSIS